MLQYAVVKTVLIISLLVTSLALNAQTLQGKVVRVADGDTITTNQPKGETNEKTNNCVIDCSGLKLRHGDGVGGSHQDVGRESTCLRAGKCAWARQRRDVQVSRKREEHRSPCFQRLVHQEVMMGLS